MAGRKLARMSKGAGNMAPQDVYGSITSDPSDMSVSHTPGSAGHMFTLAEGELSAEAEGYSVEGGELWVAMPQDMSEMSIEYSYDAAGLRTQKKVIENGAISITDYTLHGKLIMELRKGNDTLHFFYDAQSRPAMVEWNGVWYSYLHNLQGDIIAIVDTNGNKVVEYKYDSWGRLIATTGSMADTLGKLNPFRYRGYLYDDETGLYYLRTRYYNPEWCRFINEDSLIGKTGKLLSHNMFAYCENNPIIMVDSDGSDAIVATQLEGVFGFGHMSAFVQDSEMKWHFFYWGDTVSSTMVDDVDAMNDVESMNKWLRKTLSGAGNRLNGDTDADYNGLCYIEGDFTASLSYFQDLETQYNKDVAEGNVGLKGLVPNRNYNLATRNCTQETIRGLYKGILKDGTTFERQFTKRFAIGIIPNCNFYNIRSVFGYHEFKKDKEKK